MDLTDQSHQLIRQTIQDRPEMASALLLGVAIERDLLSSKEAQHLAEREGLKSFEVIKNELAVRMKERGRTQELAELLSQGRRALRHAQKLVNSVP